MASGHSAAASAAGYLYQTNWALLDLLLKAPSRPDQAISLEMHDDVAWTDDGTATELLQTKLHAKATAGLGDKDTDVWKTLAVWMDRDDCTDPHGADLALVTTSVALASSAAYALRPDPNKRDVPCAAQRLVDAAQELTNQSTEKPRKKFLSLSPAERMNLLTRVRVLDGQLPPEELDREVWEVLTYGLPPGQKAQNRFLAEIWRWWAEVSVDMLAGRRAVVEAGEVLTFVWELRSRFSSEDLPTTVQIAEVTPEDVEKYDDARFVAQMKLVNYSSESLRLAVIDYHRAVTQETQWIDDYLLDLQELRKFEDNLRFEWSRVFNHVLEDLEDLQDDMDPVDLEKEKVKAGRNLLRSLLASTAVSVRKHYNDAFYARGKRHELADESDHARGIGWHPDFASRLEAVITSA